MRPLAILVAAVPLALGCAQQSAVHRTELPKDGSLQVQLRSAPGLTLEYVLSEPAYVAVFAITFGQELTLLFPYSAGQLDRQAKRGINRLWHSGAPARGYYIIASRSPLPLQAILQSPELLPRLIGDDAFRGVTPSVTWEALDTIMAMGLANQAWASSSQMRRPGQHFASRIRGSRVYGATGDVVVCTGGRVPSLGGCWRPPERD